jgi:DNA-binding winged helix-turn-helix (wHTH) protein
MSEDSGRPRAGPSAEVTEGSAKVTTRHSTAVQYPAAAPLPAILPGSEPSVLAGLLLLDLSSGKPERWSDPGGRGAGQQLPVLVLAHGGLPERDGGSELVARLLTALGPAGAPANAVAPARHRFGKAWLDLGTARLTGEDGTEIPITAMEFFLLRLFARNPGRVLNRDQILEGAHDRPWNPFDRSIDIRISRIRRKIEVNPEKPVAIRTVRGIGYVYDPS